MGEVALDPRLQVGANNPPLDEALVAEFAEALATGERPLKARAEEVLASVERATAVDDDTAGRCTDLIRLLRGVTMAIEDEREKLDRPLRDASQALIGAERKITDRLYAAKARVEALLDKYTSDLDVAAAAQRTLDAAKARDDEVKRKQADDDVRRRAEEAGATVFDPPAETAPPPPARPPAPAPPVVRGAYGGRASRTTKYDFRITSWPLVLELLEDNALVREAATKVIAGMVRNHQRKIAGVEVFPVGKLNVR